MTRTKQYFVWIFQELFKSRSLEKFKGNKSLNKFRKAEEILNWRDIKTCSVCLLESKDKYAREKHNAIVHRHESQKFKCDVCPKSYTSQSSLEYHAKTHQEKVEKPACELCGKHFTTIGALSRWKKLVLTTDDPPTEKLCCEQCGQKFSLKVHLKHHQREHHFNLKFNIDFQKGEIHSRTIIVTNANRSSSGRRTLATMFQMHIVKRDLIVCIVARSLVDRIIWRDMLSPSINKMYEMFSCLFIKLGYIGGVHTFLLIVDLAIFWLVDCW